MLSSVSSYQIQTYFSEHLCYTELVTLQKTNSLRETVSCNVLRKKRRVQNAAFIY